MNRFRIRCALLLSLAACGLLGSLSAVAQITHLEVDNDALVTLTLFSNGPDTQCGGSSTGPFVRVGANGDFANSEFQVPPGQELIVTDVVWSASANWSGGAATLRFFAFQPGSSFLRTVLNTPVVLEPENGSRVIGGTVNLTAGTRVATRRVLCVSRLSEQNNSTFVTGSGIRQAQVFGYLIDK